MVVHWACPGHVAVSCYNVHHGFKGTFGAPGPDGPRAVSSEDGREQSRGKSGQVTRRRRPGFNLRSRRCGGGSLAAAVGRAPYGAAAAAHGTPVTGRLRSPPYPAAAPARATTRPSTSRRVRQ
jgi:hypothetical protein